MEIEYTANIHLEPPLWDGLDQWLPDWEAE
jgi:hypothetical protein